MAHHQDYRRLLDGVQHMEQVHSMQHQDSSTTADSSAQNSGDLVGWIEGMIEELSSSNHTPLAPHYHQDASYQNSLLRIRAPTPDYYHHQHHQPNNRTSNNTHQGYDHHLVDHSQQDKGESSSHKRHHHQDDVAEEMGEEENCGVQLVHSLLACAECIQRGDLRLAKETLNRIQALGLPVVPGPMSKVAAHFVEALTRRLYGVTQQNPLENNNNNNNIINNADQSNSLAELLHFQFYETCPYLKFAHFTANQAILEACEGQANVHVIDLNLMHGLQWPALIQALALRPGGPPHLRLTGIGKPAAGRQDTLQEIGTKLGQLAESVHVKFDFRGVFAEKLNEVQPWMLQVRQGEAVAVNSVLQLHKLLYSDHGHPPPIDDVLHVVRTLKPSIFTVVEQEASHNSPSFLDRFTEALHYYSTMFDSLEACHVPDSQRSSHQKELVEMYLGREICNIVACEDASRVERHENLAQWRLRMSKAGYRPLHLSLNAFKDATMLLSLFSGEGYRVQETLGCLTLGWHSRPLLAASAWRCV